MKKCTYCGREYPDEVTLCAIDQQPLAPEGQLLAQAAGSATPSPKSASTTPPIHTVKPAMMARIRSLHLYLGCIFAPMLLLFALSGIWQTLGIHGTKWMSLLSSIHTSHGLKQGTSLTSPFLRFFIVLMAMAFIISTILGVIMAVKYGRNRRAAYYCLAFGVAFPLLLVLIQLAL
jgi:hypothetical protein